MSLFIFLEFLESAHPQQPVGDQRKSREGQLIGDHCKSREGQPTGEHNLVRK